MSYAPRDTNPKPTKIEQEPTGAITKDSLAAESIAQDGGFAENENAEPLGVRGDQSTLNTTDTSGASTLRSATNRQERADDDDKGLGWDEKGPGGTKYPDADLDTSNTSGFSGATGDSFGGGGGGSASAAARLMADDLLPSSRGDFTGASVGSYYTSDNNTSSSGAAAAARLMADDDLPSTRGPVADDAPNYIGTVTGDIHSEGQFQPKGRNLVEGGDLPAATKTFTGNVGGQHDPGRLAEQKFQATNAENDDVVATGGGGVKYRSEDGQSGGQYDVLSNERA